MVKDHIPREEKEGIFYMHHSTDRIAHTTDSHGALAGTRNNFMAPPDRIDPTTYRTKSGRSTTEIRLSPIRCFGYLGYGR